MNVELVPCFSIFIFHVLISVLKHKWSRLRAYKVKLHKKRTFTKSGSGASVNGGGKQWEHENHLDFVMDSATADQSVSNMDTVFDVSNI